MSFVSIPQSLLTILNTVKAAPGSVLQEVIDTDLPETVSGYPYVILTPGETTEESLDGAYNQTLYNFTLRAVDVSTDKVAREWGLRQLADAILAEFRKRENLTLSGTVDRFLPFSVSWGYGNDPMAPERYFEISIQVLKSWNIGN